MSSYLCKQTTDKVSAPSDPTSTVLHPYYPVGADVVGWVANEYSVERLLLTFSLGCAFLLSGTACIARSLCPALPRSEVLTVMWFTLSGSLHVFFEGYFLYNHASLAQEQTIFGQLWKEYALADSRYLTSNPFVLCIEAITVCGWGPLCFVVASQIISGSSLRHPLQLIVSTGHLYSDVLYYATSLVDNHYYGISYSRPEHHYYWGYYVFMNAIWIVIPIILIYDSVVTGSKGLQAVKQQNARDSLRKDA